MLDQAISSALFRLHLLERAVHGSDQWELVINGVGQFASRLVEKNAVSFSAVLPIETSGSYCVELRHEGEYVGTEIMQLPASDACQIDWELRLAGETIAS